MPAFTPPSPFRLAALALVLSGSACSSGGGVQPAAAGPVTAAGAVIEITEGPLRGAKVVVPPGAVRSPIDLTIAPGFARVTGGVEVVGRSVIFGPASASFLLPVSVTLPFNDAIVSGEEIVVTAVDGPDIVELGPARREASMVKGLGLVTFDTLALRTCWTTQRILGGVVMSSYLPLRNGNEWEFDTGLKVTTVSSMTEPNLAGEDLFVLLFENQEQNLGLYLRREETSPFVFGPTQWRGSFVSLGPRTYQWLQDDAGFIAATTTLGRPVLGDFDFETFEPFGATDATGAGVASQRVTIDHPGVAVTGVGTFDDTLRVRISVTFDEGGAGTTALDLVMVLVDGVGPVSLQLFGTTHTLASATVNNQEVMGTPLPKEED